MAKSVSKTIANDDIGSAKRLELYRLQIEIRDCEQRAYELFLQNLIKGTSHLSLGQEAISCSVGVAMRSDDVLLPSFVAGIVGYQVSSSLGISYFHEPLNFVPVFSSPVTSTR